MCTHCTCGKSSSVEFWLPVRGYPNYEVSDKGRVRALSFGNQGGIRVLKEGKRRDYRKTTLYRGNGESMEVKHLSIHAVVLEAFNGPRPEGKHVNHKNGVKCDNRLSNLEYVTRSENMKHAFATGLQSNVGINHSQAKLNDEKVREIRKMIAQGMANKEIAPHYGVHYTTIHEIRIGNNWTHVT